MITTTTVLIAWLILFFSLLLLLLCTSNAFLLSIPATTKEIAIINTRPTTVFHMTKVPLPFSRRAVLASTLLATAQLAVAQLYARPGFTRIPTQFIAALGDPLASTGNEAKEWGIWTLDPGPRGVFLKDFQQLEKNSGRAPAGWTFSNNDWWLEEHGLIMEPPNFPLSPGRYLVTGGRRVTTVLDISPSGQWSLEEGTMYDVTHLPCRSARYKPNAQGHGSPATAKVSDFPVIPGAEMPVVEGCDKQDYAVIFVIGKANDAEL